MEILFRSIDRRPVPKQLTPGGWQKREREEGGVERKGPTPFVTMHFMIKSISIPVLTASRN